MNSKRPSINTTRAARPKAKRPRVKAKAKPKVQPKGNKSTITLGHCLLCGEAVKGPAAIRMKHGIIRRKKPRARPKTFRVRPRGRGSDSVVEFAPVPFEDRTKVKWVCFHCATESFVLADEGFRFSSKLEGLSADGQCCLCRKVIEPHRPGANMSSAVLLERGFAEGERSMFKAKEAGHVHFFCMDDLHIELWRLIEQSDTPDPAEWEAAMNGGG